MADVQVLRLIDASFDEVFRTQNSRWIFPLISTFSSTWKCPTFPYIGMMLEKLDDDYPMVQPKK